ncbi:MAG: transposase [Dactylosporangium sp.]|nr:transposase [Dactylosporangium sp.]
MQAGPGKRRELLLNSEPFPTWSQSAFHWHVLDKGIAYIKPHTPRLNGKVERSHRVDAEEFYRMLEGVVIDDAQVFNDKLREWEDYNNYHRPHGGLGARPLRTPQTEDHDPAVNDHRRSHKCAHRIAESHLMPDDSAPADP